VLRSDQIRTDVDACTIAGIREVPQALATSVSGGYSNPGSVQCSTFNGFTNCNNVGAFSIPATASTFDANAELRGRPINRCMGAKGYQIVGRPACRTTADRQGAERFAALGLPQIGQFKCINAVRLN
jgi:hypothetical protein